MTIWLTHAPIHPNCLGRFLGNCHGHVHANPSPPGKYLNCCVEALDYQPISLEEAADRLRKVTVCDSTTIFPL